MRAAPNRWEPFARLPAEHGLGGTRAQSSVVVDVVAAGQRRVEEGQGLHARVAHAGGAAEMHMLVEERLEASLSARVAGSSRPASATM
jgi:hypothetical protein